MKIHCALLFLLAAGPGYCVACPAGISEAQATLQLRDLVAGAQGAFEHGDYPQAADHFRQAICYAPQNGSLYYGLGLAEAAASHFDRAHTALEQANRLSPGTPHLLLALAQVSASAGNIDEAVRLLAERDRLGTAPAAEQQDAPQLRAQLAQALLAQNRLELALAQLLRLKQMGAAGPPALLTLATLENNLCAWSDATEDSAKVAGDPATTPAQRAAATAVAGLAFKNANKPDDAIRMLEASVQWEVSEVACLALADVHNRREQMQKALDLLKSCAAKLPQSAAVATELGKNLVTTGGYEEAETVLRGVTQTAPGEPEAWRWLAQAQTSRGDYGSAVESLQQIARIKPDYPTIDTMIAQAILKAENPDYAQALQYLDRAAKASAAEPDVFYLRGKVFFSMGRFNEAIESLQKAVQLGPNALTCYQLGRALHAVGREAEARQQFERVQLFKSIGQ
jgi:tetratricopeptide (TPR) repeat protein